jgi:hypothetical protein
MRRPISGVAMLRSMLRGALGTLGQADMIERFEFTQGRCGHGCHP